MPYLLVVAETCPVKELPEEDAPGIGEVHRGSVLEVVREQGDMLEVQYCRHRRWVHAGTARSRVRPASSLLGPGGVYAGLDGLGKAVREQLLPPLPRSPPAVAPVAAAARTHP